MPGEGEQGGAVDASKLNTMGGGGDDAVMVKPKGHGTFQEARDEAVQKGKAAQAKAEKDAEFKTKVEGASDHLMETVDWDKIEKQVTGEEELAKKIGGWKGGITPENKEKLDALRKKHMTNEGGETTQQPAAAGAGQPQQPTGATPGKVAPTAQPTQKLDDQAGKAAAQPEAPPKPKFNPFTGEALAEGEEIKFDPITGKPIGEAAPAQAGKTLDIDKITNDLRETLRKDLEAQMKPDLDKMKADLEAANKERADLIAERDRQKEMRRQEQEERSLLEFKMAAKQSNVPDDLVNFAYERAKEIVNSDKLNPHFNEKDPAKRQMSYEEIMNVMRETNPNFFREKSPPGSSPDAQPAGAIQPKAKAGTGTGAGGGTPPAPNTGGDEHKKGADSFEGAGQLLRKAARQKFGG